MKTTTAGPVSHKRQRPHVGEVVLLRADVAVQLPLLVTRVEALPRQPFEATRYAVWGQVVTDPDSHNDTQWVRENRFWKPSAEQPTFLVSKVLPGRSLGEWEFANAGHHP